MTVCIREAKKEGKLVVYSGSSRMPAVALEFEKLYPGINVEVEAMGTAEAIEKFEREAVAGLHRVDVFQASQAGRQKALLYDRNYLFTMGASGSPGTCLPLIK